MPESSLYYNLIDSPLRDATIDDLENYPWPNPDDSGYLDGIAQRARQLSEENKYGVVGNFAWESWYERAWKLRAMDIFYMDMVANKEFVHALLDKTLSLHLRLLDNVLEVCGKYIDVIIQGGGLGRPENNINITCYLPRIYQAASGKGSSLYKRNDQCKNFLALLRRSIKPDR